MPLESFVIPPTFSMAIAMIRPLKAGSTTGAVAVVVSRGRRLALGDFAVEVTREVAIENPDFTESPQGNPVFYAIPTVPARPGHRAGRPIRIWVGYHADDLATADLRVRIEVPEGYRVERQIPEAQPVGKAS